MNPDETLTAEQIAKLRSRPEVVARINERNRRMSEAISRGESDLVPDRPLTEEERGEIELIAGDEDDVEAQEEAKVLSVGN